MDVSGATAAGRADLARGTHQPALRAYHARLLLSLIRRHGSLPKAEIARLTGLSAQTASVIMRRLEADGLLTKEAPKRGKVGQPLVPFSLNPEGAFFIGLKIGRRSGDLILLDLAGHIRAKIHQPYAFPTPGTISSFVKRGLDGLSNGLDATGRNRIAGLGIAVPFELWNWEEETGADRAILDAWRGVDVQKEIEALCPWPVYFCNDATAACAGELVFGSGAQHRDYIYFFVSYFIGGGVVLNGSLFPGRSGYAGAVGTLPVPDGSGRTQQLIRSASLYVLERSLSEAGRDPSVLWQSPDDWGDIGRPLEDWIARSAQSLSYAITAAASVIDFPAVIIDGAFPAAVRERLVGTVRARMGSVDTRGLAPFEIISGTIGSDARAMGAASLPLLANFAADRDVLFKETT
ncbi:ROK family transcriptional regulator [Taklimakanibacter lacteus]|uniref:ROK family transcriptional regulator n=1 Tax=Taklimakanibacter lacteus TaxID=2268456 RepID=UPI000E66C9D3